MPAISLRPTNGVSSVTEINCGYSRTGATAAEGSGTKGTGIGGALDLKQFTGLKLIKCIGNDIVECTGYKDNPNIETLDIWDNKITGELPNINSMSGLKNLRAYQNQFSGPWQQTSIDGSTLPLIERINIGQNSISGTIPILVNTNTLQRYDVNTNKFSGGIPDLTGAAADLRFFSCFRNELSGEINTKIGGVPDLTGLTKLTDFLCYENLWLQGQQTRTGLTGVLPILSKTGAVLDKLVKFMCYRNAFSGGIPSLTGLVALEEFMCYENSLTGSIPDLIGANGLGQVGASKIKIFRCDSNGLNGAIPTLTGLTTLQHFACGFNPLITGTIPNLTGLSALHTFSCNNTQVDELTYNAAPNSTKFTIPATLGTFQAYSTNLSVKAIDAILKGFVEASGSPPTKLINITGTRPTTTASGAAGTVLYPSFSGTIIPIDGDTISKSNTTVTVVYPSHPYANGDIITVTAPTDTTKTIGGGSFSRVGNTVTVTVIPHNYVVGQTVRISDDSGSGFPAELTSPSTTITSVIPDQSFTYTTLTSGTLIGSGFAVISDAALGQVTATSSVAAATANSFTYTTTTSGSATYPSTTKFTIRKAGNVNDGYYAYQQLTQVGRSGGVWNVSINHPTQLVTV
jgi:Leucine-rich repeat (LRR) protein